MLKYSFLFIILLFISSLCYAQRPIPGALPRVPGEIQVDSTEQEELTEQVPDTILIFHPFQLNRSKVYDDTTLYDGFQQYEAARLQDIPYLNNGNFGSPHRPGMFIHEKRQGLDIGSHVLDLYRYNYEDLNLMESKRPIAIFRLAQKNFKQDQLQLETKFSKTFQNGLHLNLNFRSIQYKGDFNQQINKNRCGDFNVWYHAPKGNYDFIFGYLYNDLRQQDNGGIAHADSLLLIDEYRTDPLIINQYPIDGLTRQQDKSFSLQNGFNIQWKGNKVGVSHRISTNNHLNRYVDGTTQKDSTYYGDHFYTRDTVELNIKVKGIVNEIYLDGLLDTSTSLRAGIKHEYYNVYQSAHQSVLNLLSIVAKYHQTIAKRFQLTGDGQWGVLENLGEYYIHGQVEADSKTLGAIEGHAIFQRSPVPLIYQQVFDRNNNSVFQNHFIRPIINQLGGSLNLATLKFKASIDQSILSNTLYLDAQRLPAQTTSSISVTQLSGDKAFDIGKFHSRHKFMLQVNTNNEVLRLPAWYIQNTVYYQDHWFKNNMFLQLGLDSRVLPSFKTKSYFPLLGNYYNPVNTPIQLHPGADLFFNFQLQNFRGFFKMEGLEYYIFKAGKTFFEHYDQPLYRNSMRIGFTWTMRD